MLQPLRNEVVKLIEEAAQKAAIFGRDAGHGGHFALEGQDLAVIGQKGIGNGYQHHLSAVLSASADALDFASQAAGLLGGVIVELRHDPLSRFDLAQWFRAKGELGDEFAAGGSDDEDGVSRGRPAQQSRASM